MAFEVEKKNLDILSIIDEPMNIYYDKWINGDKKRKEFIDITTKLAQQICIDIIIGLAENKGDELSLYLKDDYYKKYQNEINELTEYIKTIPEFKKYFD